MVSLRTIRWASWGLLALSLALYIAACAAPAIDYRTISSSLATGQQQGAQGEAARLNTWSGGGLLLMGWAGLISGEWAWLANLLLPLAWLGVALRVWPVALGSSLLAFLPASSLLQSRPLVLIGSYAATVQAERLRIGCYLWLASMAVVVIGTLVFWKIGPSED